MERMTRRQFIQKSALTVVATSTCMCALNSCATFTKIGKVSSVKSDALQISGNTLTIDLSKETNLKNVGEAIKIKHKDIPDDLIVAHVTTDRFEAASLYCTHRGVEVEFDNAKQRFQCASMGSSMYTMDGKNVSGPAKKPLHHFDVVLDNDLLQIHLS